MCVLTFFFYFFSSVCVAACNHNHILHNGNNHHSTECLIAEIDKQFVQDTSGSTMCAVIIDQQGMLTCANIGDSRAVLCRGGRAVPLCRDQKADSPSEIGRIVE